MTGTTQQPTFVVFSDDWGEHMSSSQHLFRHIAKDYRTLWVNTVGMRKPKFGMTDLRKAWRKLSRMFRRPPAPSTTHVDPSCLRVCAPFMLPLGGSRAVRAFNAWSVTRTVRKQLRQGPEDVVFVSSVPNAGDYQRLFKNATVVYYCVDDFTQWPGLEANVVREMEQQLIDRADVLVAASELLRDRLKASDKHVLVLEHGVDVDLFSRQVGQEHTRISALPRPRAGFFGLIDERLDQELLGGVAKQMADFTFVFAGPVVTATDTLSDNSNIHFIGPLPYDELPAFVAGLDVLIIPYATGEFTDTLAPLKLKEYLATGLPIVSSRIAGTAAWNEHVAFASSVDEWRRALSASTEDKTAERRRQLRPIMELEAWSAKAHTLVALCLDTKADAAAGCATAAPLPVNQSGMQ